MDWMAELGSTWRNTLLWLAGLAVAFAVLSRLMPCNRGMYWWRDPRAAATDFAYWFIVPLFLRLAKILLLAVGISLLFGGQPRSLPVRELPLWQQAVLILLIQDVLLYWIHRIFHTRPIWKFHAIHHSPKVLDWTAAARFHPVNNVLEFVLADVVVLLAGFSPEALVALAPFNLIYSAMVHANLSWTFGPLRYVFASPVFHRWHHTAAEEGGAKNFASTFTFLDLMFGTYYMPADRLPERFGTDAADFPAAFWRQYLYPFRIKFTGIALAGAAVGLLVFHVWRGTPESRRDLHLSQARSHFHNEEYDRAIRECTEAIREDAGCAQAFADRAASYFRKGELDHVIADCTRAVELNPRLALAYATRGGAYVNRGDADRAVADCAAALEIDPRLALAYVNRGGAYLNKGDFDRAIADCTQALALDPGLTVAYLNRAAAHFNKGEVREGIADFDEAIRLEPRRALAYVQRGMAYFRLGESEKALQDFNRAIALDANLAAAYAYRGAIGLGLEAMEQVIADCSRAIELNPQLAQAYWIRGVAYARQGDSVRAGSDRDRALQLDPSLGQP